MARTTRRLGRGLSSLVANLQTAHEQSPGAVEQDGTLSNTPAGAGARIPAPRDSRLATVSLETLRPNPFQPRNNPSSDNVSSLAASIEANGLIQPIVVRPHKNGYQIITGERRWWAAQQLGRRTVPVVVREATDEQMLELALVENIQREDLNAIDRAQAYRNYCTRFGASPEEVAKKTGEDRTTVLNYLRILELPVDIRESVARGELSMGHARCLLGVANEKRQRELAQAIVRHQLSVRAVEEIVRREKTRAPAEGASSSAATDLKKSAHLLDLQSRFEEVLKTKVHVKESGRKHRGRIVIEYYCLDDFDRIAAALGVELN